MIGSKSQERLGLIQVYTGDGKGKTTAALGPGAPSRRQWAAHLHRPVSQKPPLWRAGEHPATGSLRHRRTVRADRLGPRGMIVANDVTTPDAGFGVETNQVMILSREGQRNCR